MFFISEINERRRKLAIIQGQTALKQPCILLLDGYKSRLNALAIELLFKNNIRVIVFPAHNSHITQPFDVGLASPLKAAFKNQSGEIPKWLQQKLAGYTKTAKKRCILVICIIDAWKKSATTNNIKSAWRKAGLSPFDPQIVLSNQYVRESQSNDEIKPSNCKVDKRLEISRHWTNNDYLLIPIFIPTADWISSTIRSGKEK